MNFRHRLKIIKLLLIKNWRIRLHNKISFVLLFLIPICFSLVIVISNKNRFNRSYHNINDTKIIQKVLPSFISNTTSVFQNMSSYSVDLRSDGTVGIVYTPINSYTEKVMKKLHNILKTKLQYYKFTVISAKSKREMDDILKETIKARYNKVYDFDSNNNINNTNYQIKASFGIEFVLDNDIEDPKHLKYKLSVGNRAIYNSMLYRDLKYYSDSDYYSDTYFGYLSNGFCQIQTALDLAHISVVAKLDNMTDINVFMQKMPIPERLDFEKIRNYEYYILVPIVILFNLLVMLPVIVKRIVEEKATKITDYLVILGVGKTEQWISVIIDGFIVMGLQSIIIAFILDINVIEYVDKNNIIDSHSLLTDTSFTLFLMFVLIYLIQSILFACLISVFFRSPNIAVIATILIGILSFIIPISYLFLYVWRARPVLKIWGTESLSCLLPNCGLFWFNWIVFGLHQNAYSGASWSHISDPGYLMDNMTLGHIMIVMLLSYPIYAILIWYLSSVIPFKQTIVKPFYFPLKYIYDKFYKKKSQQNSYQTMSESKSLIIKNLSKRYQSMFGFKSEKVLKNIDLELETNTICVILGPNGSGKTTLINIITGLTQSKGQIIIGGFDILKESELARNELGFCPQENVFYKFLTVKEHLELFYELKTALRDRNDGNDCQQLIDLLHLKSDENKEAYTLSGGTLRRLVLGMALIGPNDVLLLDEPTAGLDPKVRRKVWDLIIDMRRSKSVLITSHHLEEANLLSDVIVIIANGEIRFRGSTLEMKKDFNSGYQLRVCKSCELNTESEIIKIISKYVKTKSFTKTDMRDNEELQFGLNFEESDKFSQMFDELELNASVLAINNISLGMTTLEDSYATIINKNPNLDTKTFTEFNDNNECLIQESVNLESKEQKSYKLIIHQIIGIFLKRVNYLSKYYILFLTLIIIPIFFISILFIAIEFAKYLRVFEKQSIDLKSKQIYGNGIKAFISSNNTGFENRFLRSYSSLIEENGLTEEEFESNNIQESLLLYSKQSLFNYFHNLLYGISTNMTNNTINLIVWYNYAAYHSLPISLNLMSNALLRQLTNDNNYEITITNSPLSTSWDGKDYSYYNNYVSQKYFMRSDLLIYMFGFTFTFASYVLLPINELRTKFKLLQLMSGLNPIVYWVSNFAIDFTIHAICSLLYALVYHILDYNEFFIGSKYSLISTYMTFLLYGFSFIPFAYLMSFFCKKPSTGFAFISLYNIIGGTIVMILTSFLIFEFYEKYKIITLIISELLLILCPIALFLFGINVNHSILGLNTFCPIMESIDPKKGYCDEDIYSDFKVCCDNYCSKDNPPKVVIEKPDYFILINFLYNYDCNRYDNNCKPECPKWSNPFIYLNSFYIRFIFYGLIYFAIILIIEMKIHQKFIRFLKNIKMNNNNNNGFELEEYESEEVKQESQYVSQLVRTGDLNCEAFVVHKLSKQFKKSLIVPKNLSFTVHKEECFGLLGINGSGKTTTFRLITGDLSICSGNAFLSSNVNLLKNKREFYSRIGYCPQNDALLDRLTGTQTLKFFGRLRGIESKLIEKFITNIVEKFDLKNIINKRLMTYSGGNRRKISLAIALIGTPELLLLDEPTTGVDPDSRLKIWRFLRDLLINYKTSILLTSHNMSECEALCSRLGILSNGVLKTIGFINDLKNSYAKGFVIILKVKPNSNENTVEYLKTKVINTFGHKCVLKYENFGVIYYHLNCENIKLSQIFRALEVLKCELNLEDYFVSNASLEQAFLSIVED